MADSASEFSAQPKVTREAQILGILEKINMLGSNYSYAGMRRAECLIGKRQVEATLKAVREGEATLTHDFRPNKQYKQYFGGMRLRVKFGEHFVQKVQTLEIPAATVFLDSGVDSHLFKAIRSSGTIMWYNDPTKTPADLLLSSRPFISNMCNGTAIISAKSKKSPITVDDVMFAARTGMIDQYRDLGWNFELQTLTADELVIRTHISTDISYLPCVDHLPKSVVAQLYPDALGDADPEINLSPLSL